MLEIISPIASKGLGRKYVASDEIVDESNYIELGLVIRNEQGESVKDAFVDVSATDSTQNVSMNGTGNVARVYVDGSRTEVYYYPFHYEFKTQGKHTITFASGIQSESVIVTVQ